MVTTLTIDPSKELLHARGKLLDRCAEALGLPLRDLGDDPDYAAPESDRSYRKRLAAHFRNMADVLESDR
jgi:hypothetical protein